MQLNARVDRTVYSTCLEMKYEKKQKQYILLNSTQHTPRHTQTHCGTIWIFQQYSHAVMHITQRV